MQLFINIHKECNHALPEQMIMYKHSVHVHKLYNGKLPKTEWIALNLQQLLASRQTTFSIQKTNRSNVGNIILATRLNILNKKKLKDLNESISSFRVKQKRTLLYI